MRNERSTEEKAPIRLDFKNDRFKKIVNHLSRQNVDLCWQCFACSSGCPFVDHMDLNPNQVIRNVQMNQRHGALHCRTIWLCVGCHTCSMQCPNGIDIAAVMDACRQLAIRDDATQMEPDIYRFHKYVYGSIERHGRLNKLEALSLFKIGSGKLLTDLDAGLKMLTRGKLDILPRSVKNHKAIRDIFLHYNSRRRSFEAHE